MYKSAIAALFVAGLISVACERPAQQADEVAADAKRAAETAKEKVSDSWITTKIESQYFADDEVKGRNIDVTTSHGVVSLTGHVDTERAKQRAVEIAKATEGVTAVGEELTVGPAPSTTVAREAREAGARATSGWITTKIQSQYFADATVKGRDIDVTTKNGVVTLEGTVDSEAARQRAVEIAKRTEGVKNVEDNLRVAAGDKRPDSGVVSRLSDAEITSRIQAKYYIDENVRGNDIDVETSNGVVTVTGSVDSEAERRQAINIARRTWGVNDVRDQLRIEKTVATTGRRAIDVDVAGNIEDAWITTKIQAKYFLDDDVKGRNIDVTTDKGVVTLAGEVHNSQARQEALTLARNTDGVKRVVDRLKVVPDTASR